MWSAEQATRVAQVVSGYGSAHLDSRLVAGSAVDSGPDRASVFSSVSCRQAASARVWASHGTSGHLDILLYISLASPR